MSSHQRVSAAGRAFADAGKAEGQAAQTSGMRPFVLGSIVLGTIGIFVHEADAHPLTATWFRCAFGLLGLTLWILLRRQVGQLRLSRRSWSWVLVAGLLMVLAWGLFFAAIQRTSAGVATVLFHVQPLWVLLLGAWWLQESIARRRLASVMVAMLGLVLATGMLETLSLSSNTSSEALRTDYWVGVAFCLVGALCMACVTIVARRLQDMPAGVLAWWQCAVGTVALVAWPMSQGWPAWGVSWAWLSGLGLIHTGLAYSLLYSGMARLSTDRIAVFQFVYPAIAIVIDWLFYGQRMGSTQTLGIALMAVAIGFAERSTRRPESRAGSRSSVNAAVRPGRRRSR